MAGIGRISGPLLKDNLLRHGVDLSFETDLLYLNVNDERIGVKTDSPSRLLNVESDIRTTDLISDDYIRISSNIVFDNQDNITTDNSVLNLNSNFSINLVGFKTDRLISNNNKISIDSTNYDLNLIPTRDTILNSGLLVQGNLHANGNITLGGNITFGNNSDDEVVFDSDFTSNLMPDIDNTFDLGEELKRWNNVHVRDITVNNIYTRNLTAGSLNLTYNFTNTIFVAVNGNDVTNRGNIFVSPYRSIAKALSEASAGDTIRIMPGEYEEDFPLTVPAGVSIVGENLRSVTIKPSASTVFNNAFLLNGETTVTNITVKDFNYSISTFKTTLDNPNAYGTSASDQFGRAIAISGNYAIVGASSEDDADGDNSGKAYIFDVTTGSLVHTLDNPNAYDTSGYDNFGISVAIDGNYCIVGASGEDDAGGFTSGKAYIYNVSTGSLVHTLDNPNAYGTSNSDNFGLSVAISGNYCIVGAVGEDDAGGLSAGKAYIFNVTTGALVYTLDDPNAYSSSAGDNFGSSVAIDGDHAIVGAPGERDSSFVSSGKAYIFDVTTGNLLHTLDNPNAYGTTSSDYFGWSVAISGNRAVVGAWGEDPPSTGGVVYIFDVTTGNLLHQIDNPDIVGFAPRFGYSVAIDGDYTVVGDYNQSKSFIFDVTDGSLVYALDNPNAYGANVSDNFGYSVSISGNHVIVGAYTEDDAGGTDSGKAYIYDFVNITESGYAFRFSPGAVISSRSPYIQNVTVITNETTAGAGDAGRGAFVDGSAVDQTSNEASMLFHAVTFITPGSTALSVTNGSRVEWLSSFTYYADKGIHATRGTLGFAGQGVRFGAEIRSIASANVYGNQGVVADGADTLVYLINHNFGYIGNGHSYDNDQTLVNQEDEVIERNSGKVYYVSQSQDGDFRVGDAFLVDFNKGDVSFGNSSIILDSLSTIVFQGTGDNRLYLRSGSIEIGDFNIAGNKIETLSSDFNIDSFSGEINLLDNTLVDGNVVIDGNFQTSGTISFGNQTTDTITFNTELEQDLLPDADNLYDLGSDSKRWKDIHTVTANTNNISISGNTIETTVVDSDLTLLSSGTGYVVLDSVYFKNSELSSTSGNNLVFSPDTNNSVIINENTSLKIPHVASNLTTSGELVLDSSSNIFQGYSSDLVNLGGVYSKDRRTQFFAHPTDDSFRFVANTTQTAILTASALQASAIAFADFNINNNILQSTDLSILIDSIDISELNFENQTITAPQNSIMSIVTTGTGYTAFGSTTALQIPNGTRQQASQSGVVGMTRFNAEDSQVETYNGQVWVPAGGVATEVVTESFVEEQITFWSLIVG